MATSRTPSPPVTDSSSSGVSSGKSSVEVPPPDIGFVPHGNLLPVQLHSTNNPRLRIRVQLESILLSKAVLTTRRLLQTTVQFKATQQGQASSTQPSTSSAQGTSSYPAFFFGPAPLPDPTTGELPTSVLARINPELNAERDTIPSLVDRILDPPHYLFNEDRTRVTLDITWAIGVIGVEHFESDCYNQRRFLRPESAFRRHAIRYGLPRVIHDWLCNEPEEETIELNVDQLRNTGRG
ncbi:uncharacterized protein EI97DRAFT_463240 [Westerdykella ornata]|uniref:Uncharacterized protein n=1 Tax=Westerdykella ornata TaxID=318751 RepID=A0A6A6JWL2_WESOR|nr:uncharacterized protein EI97DRAFT_463240 [Westerdykella ornata]KAF2280797.1 hypothetical protein EI97DRAFT_463240 [Westerdykella ornata]